MSELHTHPSVLPHGRRPPISAFVLKYIAAFNLEHTEFTLWVRDVQY
jgi:hypothetical protein